MASFTHSGEKRAVAAAAKNTLREQAQNVNLELTVVNLWLKEHL